MPRVFWIAPILSLVLLAGCGSSTNISTPASSQSQAATTTPSDPTAAGVEAMYAEITSLQEKGDWEAICNEWLTPEVRAEYAKDAEERVPPGGGCEATERGFVVNNRPTSASDFTNIVVNGDEATATFEGSTVKDTYMGGHWRAG